MSFLSKPSHTTLHTRAQKHRVCLHRSWVRIPPSPPNNEKPCSRGFYCALLALFLPIIPLFCIVLRVFDANLSNYEKPLHTKLHTKAHKKEPAYSAGFISFSIIAITYSGADLIPLSQFSHVRSGMPSCAAALAWDNAPRAAFRRAGVSVAIDVLFDLLDGSQERASAAVF